MCFSGPLPLGSLARISPLPNLVLPLDMGGTDSWPFLLGRPFCRPCRVLTCGSREGEWPALKMMIGLSGFEPASAPAPSVPAWQGRSIGTTKLRLVEFSAFLEQQRDPDSVSVLRQVRLESRICFHHCSPSRSFTLPSVPDK